MNGKYLFDVAYAGVQYSFELERNLTILKGDSATGKSFLLRSFTEYVDTNGEICDVKIKRYIKDSYVLVKDVEIHVMTRGVWRLRDSIPSNSIIFIDENNKFVKTNEFSEYVKESGNYFVIISREDVIDPAGSALPISYKSVLSFKNDNKYPVVNHTYNLYENTVGDLNTKPDVIITEDSGFGFKLLQKYYYKYGIDVITSKGNSNLLEHIRMNSGKKMFVLGDGAAIAAYIVELHDFIMFNRDSIKLFLPECFEWLLLTSGIYEKITPFYGGVHLNTILNSTYDYIDYLKYISWEKFYAALLTEITRKTYLQYDKSEDKFNKAYLGEWESAMIKKQIPILLNNYIKPMNLI